MLYVLFSRHAWLHFIRWMMEILLFSKETVAGWKWTMCIIYTQQRNTRREYQLKQNFIYMKNEVQLQWEYI